MAARRRQLEPMAAAGSKRAAVGLEAMARIASLLAAPSSASRVCSVGLGAVAEAALHQLLEPGLHGGGHVRGARARRRARRSRSRSWSTCTSSSARWCPRTSRSPARTGGRAALAPAAGLVARALRPLIRLMEGLAKGLVRALGVEPKDEVTSAFTAEEVAAHRRRVAARGCSRDAAGATRRRWSSATGRRRRRGPARPAGHRDPSVRPRPTSSGWWPSTGSPGSRCVDDRRRADRLPAPQGHPLRRRGRAARAGARQAGAPAGHGRAGDEVEDVLGPCSAPARTWPGSSTPTDRGRGRVPRGRARGAGRGGHRLLTTLSRLGARHRV